MGLNCIRLELARTPEFPNGSPQHGYEFIAPLTKDGRIDSAAWRDAKGRCEVTRFWGDIEPEQGMLRHVGKGWRFDYNPKDEADDEPFFKLDQHKLVPGQYVSIMEHDRVQRTFRVASVTPIA